MVTFLASAMASDVTWAVVSAVASASRLPLVSNVNTVDVQREERALCPAKRDIMPFFTPDIDSIDIAD